MRYEELVIEGRNAVLETFRAGKTVDRLYVQKGCQDGPVNSILREARKHDTVISFVAKERLDQMSETGKHQGVIAHAAAFAYAEVEDMLRLAAFLHRSCAAGSRSCAGFSASSRKRRKSCWTGILKL